MPDEQLPPSALPPVPHAATRILKKNIRGGVRYEVGFPPYVPAVFFAAAALCAAMAVLGWKMLPREFAGPLAFLFGFNAFITAVAGGAIRQMKRPIEVGTGGFTIAGKTAPLARVDGVVVAGRVLCRLRVLAGGDSAELMMSRRQAEWLKADIECELQARRRQTPKKGAG